MLLFAVDQAVKRVLFNDQAVCCLHNSLVIVLCVAEQPLQHIGLFLRQLAVLFPDLLQFFQVAGVDGNQIILRSERFRLQILGGGRLGKALGILRIDLLGRGKDRLLKRVAVLRRLFYLIGKLPVSFGAFDLCRPEKLERIRLVSGVLRFGHGFHFRLPAVVGLLDGLKFFRQQFFGVTAFLVLLFFRNKRVPKSDISFLALFQGFQPNAAPTGSCFCNVLKFFLQGPSVLVNAPAVADFQPCFIIRHSQQSGVRFRLINCRRLLQAVNFFLGQIPILRRQVFNALPFSFKGGLQTFAGLSQGFGTGDIPLVLRRKLHEALNVLRPFLGGLIAGLYFLGETFDMLGNLLIRRVDRILHSIVHHNQRTDYGANGGNGPSRRLKRSGQGFVLAFQALNALFCLVGLLADVVQPASVAFRLNLFPVQLIQLLIQFF